MLWAKASGSNLPVISSSQVTAVASTVPAAVKGTLQTHNLRDLYPASRVTVPDNVKSLKIEFDKNSDRLEANIRKLVGTPLESENLWFRGLNLDVLESTLAFFIPQRHSRNTDNEFGPGFYTTDSLTHAIEYVRLGGAIMVFRDPDLYGTKLWELDPEYWNAWAAKWKHLPLEIAQQPIPAVYSTADFIKGPISGGQQTGRRVPLQSEDDQLVACSYRGLTALSDSLDILIFVTRT